MIEQNSTPPEKEVQQSAPEADIPPEVQSPDPAQEAHQEAQAAQVQKADRQKLDQIRDRIADIPEAAQEVSEIPVDKDIQEQVIRLGETHKLRIHLTAPDSADRILAANYFGNAGIGRTTLGKSSAEILRTLAQLDRNYRREATPKGQYVQTGLSGGKADAAIVIAIPQEIVQQVKNEMGKFTTIDFDNYISEQHDKGKIAQWGLPNGFVWGAYYNGDLKLNPKFAPSFENAPPADEKNYKPDYGELPPAPTPSKNELHPSGITYESDNESPEDLKIVS